MLENNKMTEDCIESDWCHFYDGIGESEEEVDCDQLQRLLHEVEATQQNESMKNEKIKWTEDRDHKNVETIFDGANEMTWKHGIKEIKDCVSRLPHVLKKSHLEMLGSHLTHLFDYFMNEHSSLVQITCSTCNTSHVEWLKFLVVCITQKT